MITSLFLTIPKELLEFIFYFLEINSIVSIKKLHPFTDIQGECDRNIIKKLDIERANHDQNTKNYIRQTLTYLARDLATVIDLPDPYYIQKIFYDRDAEIKSLIPKIDYNMNIETILAHRLKYDKEFNDFYESVLRFYKENKCNTFPTHPVVISIVLDKIQRGIE